MKRAEKCAVVGVLFFVAFQNFSYAQAPVPQTITVRGWRWCKDDKLTSRCVTRESLRAVRTADAPGSSLDGVSDFTGLNPGGQMPFDPAFNMVSLHRADGKAVWVQARLLDLVYCDAPADISMGRRQTTTMMGMGSGADCPR